MARTDIHYEINKWLRGDNTVNIQGRILVLVYGYNKKLPPQTINNIKLPPQI